MTRLLITHLVSRGLERIAIVNRSMGRPKELQEQFPDIDIQIALVDELWDVVGKSDIIYTATSSADYVIDGPLLKENGLDSGRPMMLVDIAVPRNVGPDSGDVSPAHCCGETSNRFFCDSHATSVCLSQFVLDCWCHTIQR